MTLKDVVEISQKPIEIPPEAFSEPSSSDFML